MTSWPGSAIMLLAA